VACFEFTAFDCRNARSASGMGQLLQVHSPQVSQQVRNSLKADDRRNSKTVTLSRASFVVMLPHCPRPARRVLKHIPSESCWVRLTRASPEIISEPDPIAHSSTARKRRSARSCRLSSTAAPCLSRSRETAILFAATLRGFGEEQFSRSVVVEGSHASTLAQKVMHYEVRTPWLCAREVR
jgi:hypothetical protein